MKEKSIGLLVMSLACLLGASLQASDHKSIQVNYQPGPDAGVVMMLKKETHAVLVEQPPGFTFGTIAIALSRLHGQVGRIEQALIPGFVRVNLTSSELYEKLSKLTSFQAPIIGGDMTLSLIPDREASLANTQELGRVWLKKKDNDYLVSWPSKISKDIVVAAVQRELNLAVKPYDNDFQFIHIGELHMQMQRNGEFAPESTNVAYYKIVSEYLIKELNKIAMNNNDLRMVALYPKN